MNKSERFAVFVKIRDAKEREAARKLAAHNKHVQDNKDRLAELEGYLSEYLDKFKVLAKSGTDAQNIRQCYAFISELNLVIHQQKSAIQELEQVSNNFRNNWLRAKTNLEIMDKVICKFREEEGRMRNKYEQIQNDEHGRSKVKRN